MIEQPLLFGPCAKRRVQAVLVTGDGRTFAAENVCMNPQPVCPRAPGEGYEKCKTVCKQVGHAEELVLDAAWPNTTGSTITVTHCYACDRCKRLMDAHGVAHINLIGAPDA